MVSSSSRKLLKELPSQEKMDEIMSDLKAFGPQATAIMGAAYLDHALELMLRASFRKLEDNPDRRIFDGNAGGFLATLSAKTHVAYATKLLDSKVFEALVLINAIRNTFAHSLHVVDFDHELVAEDCQKLVNISSVLSGAAGLQPGFNEDIDSFAKIVTLLYRSIRRKAEDLTNA
jgi:hypothetical protein